MKKSKVTRTVKGYSKSLYIIPIDRIELNFSRIFSRKITCEVCGIWDFIINIEYSESSKKCCPACLIEENNSYTPYAITKEYEEPVVSKLSWAQEHALSEGYWPDGTGYRPDEY